MKFILFFFLPRCRRNSNWFFFKVESIILQLEADFRLKSSCLNSQHIFNRLSGGQLNEFLQFFNVQA